MNFKKIALLLTSRAVRVLPEAAERPLWRLFEVLLPLPVWRLDGESRAGGAGSMVIAGESPFVDYLPERFFVGRPNRTRLESQRVLGLRRRLLAEADGVDLVVARVDRAVGGRLAQQDFLRVPHRIGCLMQVPADTQSLARNSESLSDDLRLVRNRGFSVVAGSGDDDVARFYETLYRPTIEHRHHELATPRTLVALQRDARRGGLLWIEQRGEIVGGVVFTVRGGRLAALAMGQTPTADGRPRLGADAAIFFYVIETARRLGYPEVDFGGCRPSLHDGGTRYKRKWGMAVIENHGTHHDLLVRWANVTPAIEGLLRHTSLVFRRGAGFAAVVAGPAVQWDKLAMPGVEECFTPRVGTPFGKLEAASPDRK